MIYIFVKNVEKYDVQVDEVIIIINNRHSLQAQQRI